MTASPRFELAPLGALLTSIDSGWSPRCETSPAEPGEWGVLKVSSVTWGRFQAKENKRLGAGLDPRPEIAVRPGDLILSRANTPELVGRAVLVREAPEGLMLSDKLLRLRVDEERASPVFVNLVLGAPAVRDQIAAAATGSSKSMKNISQEKLRSIRVPVPPLPEQRKIAAILSSVDDAIDKTQAVIDQLGVVKKAMMQELLTKGLPGRHTRFKETEIGVVPEEWEVVPLSSLASIERGKFSHRPRNDPRFYGGKYPFVQTGDVAGCGGRITSYSQTLNDQGLAVSRVFPAGTIVITIAANIGDTGIAEFPLAFPDSLVGIQAGVRIDNRFLEFVLRTRKRSLEEAAPQNAQKNINLETLRPLPIQVPGREEQEQIADALELIDKRVRAEASQHQQLRRAKSSLMSVLLTGELRVTPDDNAA